jgi:MEMO1 family protein
LAEIARKLGLKIAVIGSTDLTHYGPSYHFTPKGLGNAAQQWVREENDRSMIEAMEHLETDTVIELANRNRSACSAGAAVGVAAFCRQQGIDSGKVIGSYLSADIQNGNSFVGYAAVRYP